jgi:hypothetical protein
VSVGQWRSIVSYHCTVGCRGAVADSIDVALGGDVGTSTSSSTFTVTPGIVLLVVDSSHLLTTGTLYGLLLSLRTSDCCLWLAHQLGHVSLLLRPEGSWSSIKRGRAGCVC